MNVWGGVILSKPEKGSLILCWIFLCWNFMHIWGRTFSPTRWTSVNSVKLSAYQSVRDFVKKNWSTPASFVVYFWSFQTTIITNFTTNKCEKCPSSIRCQDLNSHPLEHISPPITTRPGLPPSPYFFSNNYQTRSVTEKSRSCLGTPKSTISVFVISQFASRNFHVSHSLFFSLSLPLSWEDKKIDLL